MPRQHRAHAVMERIAGRQHADRLRAHGFQQWNRIMRRRWPKKRFTLINCAPVQDGACRPPPAPPPESAARASAHKTIHAIFVNANHRQPCYIVHMHILILGGTTEANALAALLAARPDMPATLSLAGRTQHPVLPPIAHRIGGFGGAEGLAAWLREHRVTALIDATHPFASIMPFNAAQAASATGIPLLSLLRPAVATGSRRPMDGSR